MRYWKKGVIFFYYVFNVLTSNAQSFSSVNNYVPLNDFKEEDNGLFTAEILVKGLQRKTGKNFGLEKVQLAILHQRISDIKVVLVNPNGSEVWLTNRHGRNGANYNETVFCNSGFRGEISKGTAPFTGEFLPDGRLANFNKGQNPNGKWKLKIYDLADGIKGTFGSVTLTFSNHPATDMVSKCTIENYKACKCKNPKSDKQELLPDLTLIKEVTEKEIHEIPYSEARGYGELRFGVSTFNKGFGPLEVRGNDIWICGNDTVAKGSQCKDESYPRQAVFQRIYVKTRKGFEYVSRAAGYNAYDARPGHQHFHSDDYVNYELLIPDSTKDEKNWVVACKGTKASFCIWDLGFCRDDLNNCKDIYNRLYNVEDLPNYGFKGYNDCLPEVQGLSVGGVDYYGEGFEGQNITLPKGFKNGKYFLRIEIDPKNLFKESDETNNSFLIPVNIVGQN